MLLKNPMIVFVYGIIKKWYMIVVITSLVVTYWILKGLSDAGVIQSAEKIVSKAFIQTKSVAQYCTPKIMNLSDFWECLNNPPMYNQSKEEKNLEKTVKPMLEFTKYKQQEDPYEENDR